MSRSLEGSSIRFDGEEDCGLTQPASFATIDPSSSTPRSLNMGREKASPYANIPANHIIAKKRYIILPPGSGQRPHFSGSGVRYIRQIRDNQTIGRPRKHVQTITIPSASPLLRGASNSVQPAPRHFRSTQYVLKIPIIKEDKKISSNSLMKCQDSMSMSEPPPLPLHIPTVPPSMSMGGEYTEEELLEQEDNDDFLSGYSFYPPGPPMQTKHEQNTYNCSELDCFWRGSSLSALRRHNSTAHPPKQVSVMLGNKKLGTTDKPVGKPKGVRCSECDTLAYSRPLLLKHMNHVHGFEAPLINRTFENREDLQAWLEELRETHAVEFVVSSGSKKWGYGLQVHYLTCSRSGEQKERPNKKFARPPRPSIKCGKNCMAYLKIKQNPVTSTLQIEGCLYHSGHFIDGNLIQLNSAEQRKISAVAEQFEQNLLYWDSNNMGAVRDILGNSGRFRLIQDAPLCDLLHVWIKQYREDGPKVDTTFAPKMQPSLYYSTVAESSSKYTNDDTFDLLSDNMILDEYVEYDADSPASLKNRDL